LPSFDFPGPYEAAQSEILTRHENIPSLLKQGEANLDKPPRRLSCYDQASDGVRER